MVTLCLALCDLSVTFVYLTYILQLVLLNTGLVHKFVDHKLVYFRNNAYFCTQNGKYTSIWKEHLYTECSTF